MEDISTNEFSMREILRIFFRHKLVTVIIFITILLSVYIALQLRIPKYRSTVTMFVTGKMQKDVEVQRSLGPGSLLLTQMALVSSRPIIERTVKALKLYERPLGYNKRFATRLNRFLIEDTARKRELKLEKMSPRERELQRFNEAISSLQSSITTLPMGETSMFSIIARDYSAAGAARIANVVSRAYVIFDLEQQIAALQLVYGNKNETIKKLEKFIEELEGTLDGRILPNVEAIGHGSVQIVSQAGPGSKMSMRPTKSSAYMMALIMSFVASMVITFAIDFFDDSFKSAQDVKRFLKLNYLGSVPSRKRGMGLIIKQSNPVTKYTRAYQNLSNALYLMTNNNNIKTVLFADAEGSKENAAVVANLGIFTSRKIATKVLVIDADLRTFVLSEMFNASNAIGLADIIEGRTTMGNAIQDMGSNLYFLPAGKAETEPASLLHSSMMSDILLKSKERYDMTYIHCSDLKNHAEGVILSSITDGFVVLVNEGGIKKQILKSAIEPIEMENTKIMGVIINNFRYVIPEIIYKLT